MKTTPFTHFHEALGARMAPFAGYNMPIEYPTGIKEEHLNVRNKLGVFDVSHMGEFWIKGPKAFELVQKLTTNDVAALIDGKVQYSCFPNDKGGIVDDLLVYRFSAEKYLLVVNAANIEKDWNWVVKYGAELGMKPGVELENASDNICQLAIQGPLALKAMQKLTSENVVDMEYYTFKEIPFAGIDKVIFSTTGYTGSGGCEVYAYNKDAEKLWNAVMFVLILLCKFSRIAKFSQHFFHRASISIHITDQFLQLHTSFLSLCFGKPTNYLINISIHIIFLIRCHASSSSNNLSIPTDRFFQYIFIFS